MPWHAAYSASKFGIRGVSEVLRFDLRRHNIGVSLVCPGGVDTPLVETVDIVGLDRSNTAIQKEIAGFHKIAVTPEKAASAILRGVTRNQYMVYTSFDIRFGYWWARKFALPYEIVMRIANNRFDHLARLSRLGRLPPTRPTPRLAARRMSVDPRVLVVAATRAEAAHVPPGAELLITGIGRSEPPVPSPGVLRSATIVAW